MKLRVKKLHEDAKLPQYGHAGDAGLDLYTTEAFTIAPGERKSVSTGIAVAIPEGNVGLIWEKSGLAFRHGIKTFGGVIDATYRGEIKVGLVNVGNKPHEFLVGEKVAQMIIQSFVTVDIEESELDDTARGQDGFGSTGRS